ncbi:unnamed protein product [Closterium sp. Yama58-4]|nr:unnamed protein product [Closterium sp. Yama58-4]
MAATVARTVGSLRLAANSLRTSFLRSSTCLTASVARVAVAPCRAISHSQSAKLGSRGIHSASNQGRPSTRLRAFEVSGPGAVNSATATAMREKIALALEADNVTVVDVNGDGQHVSIEVVSKLFEGKRSLDRQRMVYRAIWEELQGAVHAVDSLVTKTPSEV